MIKNVAIVSLSWGGLGDEATRSQLQLGTDRLHKLGLNVTFMPNSLKGSPYLEQHPEKRAVDLLEAFRDPGIDMILCAIGGDDTYRLLPFLFDNNELKNAVSNKIFLGFSDTTINHLMLHKVGIPTFYGQAFLSDICYPPSGILPYTLKYFTELITTGSIHTITPSQTWYESTDDFSLDPPAEHPDQGFRLLQGRPVFSGRILGGCIDTLYDIFNGERYPDMPGMCRKYGLFPSPEEWRERILLIESSEEKPSPEKYRDALIYLKNAGVFDAVSGILVGKPMDETYDSEYRRMLVDVVDDPDLPIVCNINIGHAMPRCIVPFGIDATVDTIAQTITFK